MRAEHIEIQEVCNGYMLYPRLVQRLYQQYRSVEKVSYRLGIGERSVSRVLRSRNPVPITVTRPHPKHCAALELELDNLRIEKQLLLLRLQTKSK